MVPIKIGGISYNLPASYGELTCNQFAKLSKIEDQNNMIELLSILLSVDKEILEQCDMVDIDLVVLPFLSYLNEPMVANYIIPDKIEIKGVWYPKPKGIGVNTYGQKNHLQREVAKYEKAGLSDVDLYPFAVALYMQPIVSNSPYNADKVDDLIGDIKNCRINEVWPIASFFLMNYLRSTRKKQLDYLTSQAAKKSEQGLINSIGSESFQRYSVFRRFLIKLLRRSFWKSTISYT